LDLCARLERESPGTALYPGWRADAYNQLAVLLEHAGRLDESACWQHRKLVTYQQLARADAGNARYLSAIGGSLHNLALLQEKRQNWEDLCRLLEEAIECQKQAVAQAQDNLEYQGLLRNHYELLGGGLMRRGLYDEAGKAFDRAHEISLVLY